MFLGFDKINIDNFKTLNWRNIFIPYGVILYSLAGIAAIPEISNIFSRENRRFYKRAIIWGTLIPGIIYLIFIAAVIGLTGLNTSPEAIDGLADLLGKKVVFMGALFGFFVTITSYFILGLSLKETFWCDFKINKNLSWFLACFIPLLLFGLGTYDFVTVIILLGALMGGIEGTAVVLIHRKAKKLGNQTPDYSFKEIAVLRYAMILVFILGFVYTIIKIIV